MHIRTSNTEDELHVAPINCFPKDGAWDTTRTFLKAGRVAGMTANIGNLEPAHVPQTSTDPVDAGFKRAVADGDLARNFRTWAHTFIGKEPAETPGFMMAAQKTDADWIKLAAQFANSQATSAAAAGQPAEESRGEGSKIDQLLEAVARHGAQTDAALRGFGANARCAAADCRRSRRNRR